MKISDAKIRKPSAPQIVEDESSSSRISILSDTIRGEFLKVPITHLRPYKNQARKTFSEDELKPLADTIKEYGIRQPLTVTLIPDQPGFYEVISGERRLRAAQLIGLERIHCIILENEKQVYTGDSIPKKVKHEQKPVLLRVSSGEEGLEVFTSKLYLLDREKKEKLKELLEEFIKSL